MPADEAQRDGAAGELRARTGPRHAAPRKPILTRLSMPAGKAVSLAAIPSAILMGMGLTPTLAVAKPLPKNPFQDGPCVTAPDKEVEDEKKDDAKKDEEKKDEATPTPSASEGADAGKGDEPGATPSPSAGDSGSGESAEDEKAAEPEPTPSPSETKNPLDPLGVGEKIKDFFTPDEPEAEPSPSASPSPSESAGDSGDKDTDKPVGEAGDLVKDAVDGAKDGVEDAADKAKKELEDAADKAEASAGAESTDLMAPDENGKKPFPCVVEKKVAGDEEIPPAPIPDQPWYLEASSLLLKGADYEGVFNITTAGGKTKQVLKYVIKNGTDIGDLHQKVDAPGGKTAHIQASKGSTSTIRDGETIMYTESISGKLFGLIPITFDPEHPPPLNIPLIYFTDVKVTQAAQFGGTLTVPGLKNYID